MSLPVFFLGVVKIVCGQQWNVEVSGQLNQIGHHPFFDVNSMIHQFNKVIFRPKGISHPCGCFAGLVVLTQSQPGLHLATGATTSPNQSLAVLVNKLHINSWLEVETIQRRL